MLNSVRTLRYGTPFLLSLGLSETLTSLVWLAGPISGLIAQPVIGEENTRHLLLVVLKLPYRCDLRRVYVEVSPAVLGRVVHGRTGRVDVDAGLLPADRRCPR